MEEKKNCDIAIKDKKSLEVYVAQKDTFSLVLQTYVRTYVAYYSKKKDSVEMKYNEVILLFCMKELVCRMKKSEKQKEMIWNGFLAVDKIFDLRRKSEEHGKELEKEYGKRAAM